MSLTLDLDAFLAGITATAAGISGIRHAYDHDDWPDSPPGMFNRNSAMHLTGFPEEGDGANYIPRGMDLSEWEFTVPLYTVVVAAAQVKRSRSWIAPYYDRYRLAYDTLAQITNLGTGNTGSRLYMGATVVRAIPDWDGYDGYYMLRHRLLCHVKGAVVR